MNVNRPELHSSGTVLCHKLARSKFGVPDSDPSSDKQERLLQKEDIGIANQKRHDSSPERSIGQMSDTTVSKVGNDVTDCLQSPDFRFAVGDLFESLAATRL